jgi:hypothetical protein
MVGIRALAIAVVATLALVGAPSAASSHPRGQSVPVQLSGEGRFLGGGQTAMVRVRTVCATGWSVIEAFVSIEQDGHLSQAGFFHPICDGVGRIYVVEVPALEALFHEGDATGTAFVLLLSPGGHTRSGQDTVTVTLREWPS